MDKRIFLTFLAVILLVAFIFLFRTCTKPCELPDITFSPEHPEVGTPVHFELTENVDENINWDFGDNKNPSSGTNTDHVFSAAGPYSVKASADKNCFKQKEIIIAQHHEMQRVKCVIKPPANIFTDKNVTFTDSTKGATQWNWKIVETGETGNMQSFTSIFKKEGMFTVSLSVKGDTIAGDTTFGVKVLPSVISGTKRCNYLYSEWSECKNGKQTRTVLESSPANCTGKPVTERNCIIEPPVKGGCPSPPCSISDFQSSFISIANKLDDPGEEGDKASDDWQTLIEKNCCLEGAFRVTIADNFQDSQKMLLDNFKYNAINGDYEVQDLKCSGGGNKCITITVITVKRKKQ